MERQVVAKVKKAPCGRNHPHREPARSSSAAHPLLELQRSIGNHAMQSLVRTPYIQTKLQISTPGDPFELEADRVADTVMRMPEPQPEAIEENEESKSLQTKALVQRAVPLAVREDDEEEKVATKLDSSGPAEEKEKSVERESSTDVPLQRKREDEENEAEGLQSAPPIQRHSEDIQTKLCTGCEEDKRSGDVQREVMIQRKSVSEQLPVDEEPKQETVQPKVGYSRSATFTNSLAANIQALHGGGSPLPRATRTFFEPRFGADFSHVRVHDGTMAQEASEALKARAFTHGSDIYFAGGESPADHGLMAHELTHVVQQGGAARRPTKGSVPSLSRATASVQRWRWPWQQAPTNDADRIRLGVAGDTDAIVEITNFSSASEPQRMTMVDHLTRQFWVGSGSEAALRGIWTSFGADFARVAGANALRWRNSVARYSGLWDAVPEAGRVRDAFVVDVKALALRNLSTNRTYAEGEMQRLGLPRSATSPTAAPTEAQANELERLQVAAGGLAKLQRAQEAARDAFVGYQEVVGRSGAAYRRVHFDPEAAPPLTALPGGSFELFDDSSQRWVSFNAFGMPRPEGTYLGEAEEYQASLELSRRLTAIVTYVPLKARYDEATAAIAAHLNAFPQLYAISVQGNSAVSGRLSNTRTPEEARAVLGEAFRTLLSNITRTEQGLNNGELNPLDLTPLHERMFDSPQPAPSGVVWSQAFPRTVGEMLARDHHIEVVLRQLLLQKVTELAFLFAPIAGPFAIPLLLVGAGAAATNLALDSARYSALAAAAGAGARPGTELVTRTAVDEARMAVEADTIALALAGLALGAAVASRVIRAVTRPRWQGPRIRSGIGQTGFREPENIANIKADMQNNRYRFESPEGQVAGWKDAQGNYYLGEGHHRMAAAMEIFEETGDPSNVNRLLQNGHWTIVERPPVGVGPLPRR